MSQIMEVWVVHMSQITMSSTYESNYGSTYESNYYE